MPSNVTLHTHTHRKRANGVFYLNIAEWEIGSNREENGESKIRVRQVEMVEKRNAGMVRKGWVHMEMTCVAGYGFPGKVMKEVEVRLQRLLNASWKNVDIIL